MDWFVVTNLFVGGVALIGLGIAIIVAVSMWVMATVRWLTKRYGSNR